MKREALGKSLPVRLSQEEARENLRRLGSQLKAAASAPARFRDNSDLVQAAERHRADRYQRFGEMVTFKQALVKVAKERL